MRRRVLTVILAVVLAGIGTGAVLTYVSGANTRALNGQKAVTVLVAQQDIPSGTQAGTALRNGWLAGETLPASSVPAEAVRSLTPALDALVTSADVPSGQLLLRSALVTAAQVTGAVAIPAGMVAVSVNLCVPEAVAGSLHPGSMVEVFDTAASGTGSGSGLSAGAACSGSHSQQNGAHTKVVLPRVEVLSTGVAAPGSTGAAAPASATSAQSSSTSASSSQGTMLVTLAVSQAGALQLIQLTQTGLPYLALVK